MTGMKPPGKRSRPCDWDVEMKKSVSRFTLEMENDKRGIALYKALVFDGAFGFGGELAKGILESNNEAY